MDHYQIQAAAAAQRKEHKAAIELYGKAISRSESIKLLDARADCYVALGDFKAALNDAKRCIKIAKTDPIGYIRAGTIFQKMDLHNDALQLMAYGLRHVKHAGQSFETLQSAHNRLQIRISPTKCVDPMTVLPAELALNIFTHLQFKSLMKLRSVSHVWNNMINNTQKLWRTLDLSQARSGKKVRHIFIEQAIKSSRLQIVNASLNNLENFDRSLAVLIRTCPLETLKLGPATPVVGSATLEMLSRATHLKILHMNSPGYHNLRTTSLEEFWDKTRDRLEEVTVRICSPIFTHAMTRLTKLNVIVGGRTFTAGTGELLAQRLPVLTSLNVRCEPEQIPRTPHDRLREEYRHFTGLEHLTVSYRHHLPMHMDFPAGLKSLSVTCCHGTEQRSTHPAWLRAHAEAARESFWQEVPTTLEELDVSLLEPISCEDVEHRLVTASTGQAPSLRKLTLSPFHGDVDREYKPLLRLLANPTFSGLEHIGLPFSSLVSDEVIEIMIQNMPKLKSINLSGTEINGTAIGIALRAPFLEELDLSFCHRMALDAITLARSKGILVRHKQLDISRIPHERSVRA